MNIEHFDDGESQLNVSYTLEDGKLELVLDGHWSERSRDVWQALNRIIENDFPSSYLDFSGLEYMWSDGHIRFLITNIWRKGPVLVQTKSEIPKWLDIFSMCFVSLTSNSNSPALKFQYGAKSWVVGESPDRNDFPMYWSIKLGNEWLAPPKSKITNCPQCGRKTFGPGGSCSYCGDYY